MQTPDSDLASLMAVPDQLVHRLGIEITEASAERVIGTMPVTGNTQPYGLLHGGASAALIETLGSVGAVQHAGPGRFAVGVDLSVTHVRSARSGFVRGVARAVHLGGSVAVYEVHISDEDDRLVCTGRLTCAIRRLPGERTGDTTA